MKALSLKKGDNWFEPVFNIYTPLLPHSHPINFLFAPLQHSSKRKLFLNRKNIEWGRDICLPNMLMTAVNVECYYLFNQQKSQST